MDIYIKCPLLPYYKQSILKLQHIVQ